MATPILWEAIKEQQAIIDKMELKQVAIDNRFSELLSDVESLRQLTLSVVAGSN